MGAKPKRTAEIAAMIADEHAPVTDLNPWPTGIRTMIGCRCGWTPKSPPMRSSTSANAHMAHRRAVGAPRLSTYAYSVYGKTAIPAAQGLTWNEFYAVDPDSDPFTGQRKAWK